jgi:hypothetical protein
MRIITPARTTRAVIVLLSAAAAGCTAEGVSYGGSVGYGVDYYEPYGLGYYEGWGPGYWIGPPAYIVSPRPYRPAPHGLEPGRHPPHAWRPPAPSHSMPSIPTRPSFTPRHGSRAPRR